MSLKIDATRPFYAVVGAGDLAVKFARTYATDVQTRLVDVQTRIAKAEIEPKALRDQARTIVITRVDELTGEAKELPAKVETYVNDTVAELNETYGDLAVRGRDLMNRIKGQQATRDAKAAVQTTVAKVKTTKTQTTKSAQASAGTAKRAANTATAAAKKTGSTAKRNTKATSTSAKKAASATTQATSDAATKIGD